MKRRDKPPYSWKTVYDDGRFQVRTALSGPRRGQFSATDRRSGLSADAGTAYSAMLALEATLRGGIVERPGKGH